MSNISRRDFLKTAGVMTLAVAAAGVLAGCEGGKNEQENNQPAANAVTIGDYTVTLKEAKQFSYKKYTTPSTEEPNKVAEEHRYVVVLGYLKNNDPTLIAKPTFEVREIAENMAVTADTFNNPVVKEHFELDVTPIAAANPDLWKGNCGNTTKEGTPFYYAYKVDSDENKNQTFSKAPSFRLVLNDTKNYEYKELTIAIPTEMKSVVWADIVNK